MVVKLMRRWPSWPPWTSRKFESNILIKRVEGLTSRFDDRIDSANNRKRLVVEIVWKGHQKGIALKRSVRRNFTEEGGSCSDDGSVVEWNEEFQSVCNFSCSRDGLFMPWEVTFTVFNGSNQGQRKKVLILGTATLNLAEFASTTDKEWFETNVPLTIPGRKVDGGPLLCLSLRLVELKTSQMSHQSTQRLVVPVTQSPLSSGAVSPLKNELHAVNGLNKVQTRDYQSYRACLMAFRQDKCNGSSSVDTDSLSDVGGESDENKNDSFDWKSINYEILAATNWFGSMTGSNAEDGSLIYYSNKKSDIGDVHVGSPTQLDSGLSPRSKLKIFPWGKRKLSFRSSKVKGEPLLKKDCREDGGDDIDFDRRFLSSSDESSYGWYKSEEGSSTNRSSVSEFGEDNFAVGSWEQKEIISRDGHMKLQTQVFFASIDQRSERAAGESACTALVAVIASWLQKNPNEIPIKSDFDSLIREGSLEWRNLCENQTYIEQFPDKHFDLETVLQAQICPLLEVPGKSFIGFFHPEGLEGENFDFLKGAMSFDNIWDEINSHEFECPSSGLVYIVSWNDHFFVLKVEPDACYIIDTLGERLYEGCNQAFIVKFDKDTVIHRLPIATETSTKKSKADNNNKAPAKKSAFRKEKWSRISRSKKTPVEESPRVSKETEEIEKEEKIAENEEMEICRGKESCKEYIKSFLAAVPIRELQNDVTRGCISSVPFHQQLQIEFHYTESVLSVFETATATTMDVYGVEDSAEDAFIFGTFVENNLTVMDAVVNEIAVSA